MIAGPRIRTLERYFARLIAGAVGFVLFGFLSLFAFFDLIKELGDLDRGEYHLRAVFLFVLLSVPAHAYGKGRARARYEERRSCNLALRSPGRR